MTDSACPTERTDRSSRRVCSFQYRGDKKTASGEPQEQQLQHQQQRLESSKAMPSRGEMPSYEEWKKRKANKPFGQEVVLLELDPKEELARRRARDQRLMSLMKPEEQEKFYTYLDHHERVQAKVQHDRESREREKAKAKRARAEAEQRKRSEHRQLRKRLERVALTTDDEFVSDVAKSKYYRLVQREQGRRFRSQDELDEFWLGELQSEGLLRPTRTDGSGQGRDAADAASAAAAAADMEVAAVTRGDDAELGGGGGHLVWEKTEDALQLGGGGGGGGGGRANFHSMSRAQQSRMLEELFPRAERPKLSSFAVNYGAKEEKTAEQLELERLQERRRRRLEERRDHRHMQQMAVTFGVATRRILDERPVRESADRLVDEADGDLGQVFGEALERARRRQQEVGIRSGSKREELDLTDPRLLQSWRKPPPEFRRRRSGGSSLGGGGDFGVDRPLTTPASSTNESRVGQRVQQRLSEPQQQQQQQQLLSLEAAQRELRQVEAKGQSSLWSNYLAAGNVRFAPLHDDQWYRSKTTAEAAEAS